LVVIGVVLALATTLVQFRAQGDVLEDMVIQVKFAVAEMARASLHCACIQE
jgi:hypothetical protein